MSPLDKNARKLEEEKKKAAQKKPSSAGAAIGGAAGAPKPVKKPEVKKANTRQPDPRTPSRPAQPEPKQTRTTNNTGRRVTVQVNTNPRNGGASTTTRPVNQNLPGINDERGRAAGANRQDPRTPSRQQNPTPQRRSNPQPQNANPYGSRPSNPYGNNRNNDPFGRRQQDPVSQFFGSQNSNPYGRRTNNPYGQQDPMDMLFGGQQGGMFGNDNPLDNMFGNNAGNMYGNNMGGMFGSNYNNGRRTPGLGSLVGSMVGGSILTSLMGLLADEFKVASEEEEAETVDEPITDEEVDASELTREEMMALPHNCPHCGAPVSRKSAICEYCDSSLL